MKDNKVKRKHSLRYIVGNYNTLPEDVKELGFLERPQLTFEYIESLTPERTRKLHKLYGSIAEHNGHLLEYVEEKPSSKVSDPAGKKVTSNKENGSSL